MTPATGDPRVGRRVRPWLVVWAFTLLGTIGVAGEPPHVLRRVKVYSEPGRFAGWPANHGIWSWGDEILVGFSRGYDKDNGADYHIDPDRPEDFLLARSKDGGATWSIEETEPARGDGGHARHAARGHAPRPRGGTPFAAPRADRFHPSSTSRWLIHMQDHQGGRRAFPSPTTAARPGAGHSGFPCSASKE